MILGMTAIAQHEHQAPKKKATQQKKAAPPKKKIAPTVKDTTQKQLPHEHADGAMSEMQHSEHEMNMSHAFSLNLSYEQEW